MAKKKKKSTAPRRRRRMSGFGGSSSMMHTLQEAVGVVIGSVGATAVQRRLGQLNPKIVSAMEVFAGMQIKNHGKSPIMAGIGWGMLSAGALGLAHDFNIIAGVDDFMNGIDGDVTGYEGQEYIHGIDNDANLSGTANEPMVSGWSMSGAFM